MVTFKPHLLLSTISLAVGFAAFSTAYGLGYTSLISLFILIVALTTQLMPITKDSLRNQYAEVTAGIGLIIFVALLLGDTLLNALIALLICAQCAINLQANKNNRVYSGLLIGLVCLLAGAAQTKEGSYLSFIAIFSLTSLLSLRSLYLLTPKQKKPHTNILHTIKISTFFLALSVVIYLLLPRFPAGNIGERVSPSEHFYEDTQWESQADQPSTPSNKNNENSNNGDNNKHPDTDDISNKKDNRKNNNYQYSGFDDDFNINNPDPKNSRFSNAIIATVKADHPLYLKARVFDTFDGIRWSQSQKQLNKKRLARGNFQQKTHSKNTTINIQASSSTYQVFIERNTASNNIPFAEEITELNFPASVIAQDAFGQWFAPEPLKQGTTYSAQVRTQLYKTRSFSQITSKTKGVTAANAVAQQLLNEAEEKRKAQRYKTLDQYLTLPQNIDPKIYTFTRNHLRSIDTQSSELSKAIYLEALLRNEYEYDFDSIFTSQNSTPLSQFLFDTKKGHCEYFASALAIMLRTQNIPTRLVTGLLAHNKNPLTGYYEVRALDGHAWVEAYVDDLGWVLLEPTAYYPMPNSAKNNHQITAETIQDYINNLERIDSASKQEGSSIHSIIRGIGYNLSLTITVALAMLKLAFLQLWWLLLSIGFIAFITPWLWRQHNGAIKNRLLLYRLKNTPAPTINQGLQYLHQALHNSGKHLTHGLTIEQFNEEVAQSYLSDSEQNQLINLFNLHFYANTELTRDQHTQLKNNLHTLLIQRLKRK